MAENLLTVAALRTNVEADLIRGKLEAAGISAVLVEPEPPAEGAPPGRVQVQVSQPDFERAMQLLFPIPKAKPGARPALPGWKCPQCGEHVIGAFPTCWKCGTARPASPEGAQPTPMSAPAPFAGVPRMPAPPLMPPGLVPPPLQSPPRLSVPETERPALVSTSPTSNEALAAAPPAANVPASAPPIAPAISKPATNGESLAKFAPPARMPRTRSPEDEAMKIVVPAWDPATGKGASGASGARQRSATEADDRAARRAWWTAVFGIFCPPLLLYSIAVVLILGLTNRPLSTRGHRFFYGALTINALLIAAFFILSGMRQ
ncbi:MAG: hypothetical protein ACREHD_14580 [Pirellulales bacterium]